MAALPHIRILMGTRNGARWLGAQLESLTAQSHDDWSLWISDDGSEDDTRALIADFAARHPGRVARLVDGPRQGSAANYLSLLTHPDLPAGPVALADQDDVWLPHKLKAALTALEGQPGPCLWAAAYRLTDADLQPLHKAGVWPRGPSLGNALVQNILSGHTLTLNAQALALLRCAGRARVPHHDWWIYLVVMAAGGRAICDPEIALLYRQHGANTVGARASLSARRQRFAGLMGGEWGAWMGANFAALRTSGLELPPDLGAFLRAWPEASGGRRAALLRKLRAHRQSRAETALLYLAAKAGRL